MPKLADALAFHIQRLRQAADMSQEKLAEKIGVSRQTISRYETAKGPISEDTIAKLASAFGVEETELTSDPRDRAQVKLFSELFLSVSKDSPIIRKLLETGEMSPELKALLGPGLVEFLKNSPTTTDPRNK